MWEIINLVISGFFQIGTCNFVVSKLSERKIDYKNYKNIITMVIMGLVTLLLVIYKNNMVKPILLFTTFIIGYKCILKITYKESIICNFICLLLYSVIELLTLVILVIILQIPEETITKYIQFQPIMGLMCFVLIYTAFTLTGKYLIKAKNIFYNDKFIYFFYIAGVLGIGIFFSKNFNNMENNTNFIINIITIISFLIIILFMFKEKIEKYNVYKEYDNMFNYLENTESLLGKYQKYNHENKNQLIYIKNLAKGNKEIEEFIDSIIEDDNKIHKDKWINNLKNIPNGGLKGFLSYKINYILDKGIKINISVSPRVKKYEMPKGKSNFQKNLCRILGVYIDNAYQACKESKKKEMSIEMLIEKEELVIIISNTYKGNINIEEMDKHGYTTKGNGHGFGLSLVNDIINSSELIRQERKVIGNFFFQYLYIVFDK